MSRPIIDTPENWGAASEGYAEKVAPFMMEKYAEEFVDRLDVNKNHEALEVACGSGAITTELASRVKSLLATDFSPQMIDYAKRKTLNAGLKNVGFKVMDGQNLELKDNFVDRVACSFGLMLFPDRHKGFSEMHRVLRPRGKAMVSGWATPDKFEGYNLFVSSILRAFPEFPKPDSPPPVFTLADLEDFKQQMEAAGFKDVSTDYVTRELELNTLDEIWDMLTIGAPPVQMLWQKVGEDGKEKVKDALKHNIQERFGSFPIRLKNTATVGIGVK